METVVCPVLSRKMLWPKCPWSKCPRMKCLTGKNILWAGRRLFSASDDCMLIFTWSGAVHNDNIISLSKALVHLFKCSPTSHPSPPPGKLKHSTVCCSTVCCTEWGDFVNKVKTHAVWPVWLIDLEVSQNTTFASILQTWFTQTILTHWEVHDVHVIQLALREGRKLSSIWNRLDLWFAVQSLLIARMCSKRGPMSARLCCRTDHYEWIGIQEKMLN